MSYKVRLDTFEGPFDLLVYLIENAQMSIYDIKISEITDQYIAYIDAMQRMDVNVASEFMVLAAALIELKSKMLLPRSSPEDGSVVEEDPRNELVARILEYKKFSLLSEMLKEQEEEGMRIFAKPGEDLAEFTKEPDEYLALDADRFVNAFRLFLQKKKKLREIRQSYSGSIRPRISTEEKISFINSFIKERKGSRFEFRELLSPGTDNYEAALTFTSILEMVKGQRIEAEQKVNFGNIMLKEIPESEGKNNDNQKND